MKNKHGKKNQMVQIVEGRIVQEVVGVVEDVERCK
jgi:hypothetical protein